MRYDYAKRTTRRAGNRFIAKRKTHWKIWLFTILIFVIFTLGLVYLGKHHVFKIQQPTQNKIATKIAKATKHKKESVIKKPTKNENSKEAPDKLASPPQPQFDFYTILPEKKVPVIVTQYELDIKTTEELAEANILKAKLIKLGFQPNIATSETNDTKLYQITLGPFDNKTAALHFQKQLSKNNISCKVKKL